jgi:integral membrane protein (TIGR01906 family)
MKKAKRIFVIVTKWLFILCLPALLVTTSIGYAVNSQWLYEYGYTKYNVGQATGIMDSELGNTTSGLIDYFNSNQDSIEITIIREGKPFTLFNQKEVAHLKDVKGLIWLNYSILLGSGSYILIYFVVCLCLLDLGLRRRLAVSTIFGSGLTIGLMLILGFLALFDFDRFFLQFHLISFANDLWQLDPMKDYLIMLFPQGFWYDATLFCAILTVLLAVILIGIAGGYLLITRRRLDIFTN